MIYFLLWALGVVAFCAWDAVIGFPVDFNGKDTPPPLVPGLFWPITFPLLLLALIVDKLDDLFTSLKERRIERANERKRIRIKLEKERREEQQAIEQEIENLEREERATRRL